MLRLRVEVPEDRREELVEMLTATSGVRRLAAEPELRTGGALVSADIEPAAADDVIVALHRLDLHHDDYVLVREDILTRGQPDEGVTASGGYSWVEILGEARANSRPVARYFLLMAVAGWIAGLGVTESSTILIVGAMAVSPDLMPICATCVGIVGRRPKLVGSSFLTLVCGMATVMVLAGLITLLLEGFGVLKPEFDVHEIALQGLAHADLNTALIALGAGVAAMLSFETRGASAVGVAISVTTVPASAYFGVALALGEASEAWGALLVLGLNLVLLMTGGSITLWLQRRLTPVHRR